ncbi:sensor histidine kinase [Pontibacter sp. SGAir0037]|uniref:sensor histidine kinase n=1 Tax=Pontibacter sp. SGAir0037 TaxID=2571030 RepID=UPI0010CD2200|nr:sensor histidine kinase [Pontibacter sp. SGAir0037]QCR25027.1 histidine kinase [Pontibacter sp. SGAir0037]
MQRIISKINITNELDVVLAYKRAMQLSERVGIALANQTKFATAVSEICRNVVEHVGNGSIQFGIHEEDGYNFLEALVSDRGRGIGNVDSLLNHTGFNSSGKGTGLINSKKLVDYFHVTSEFDKGTRVTLRKRLPNQAYTISKATIDRWASEFDNEEDISPYAEIKRQNMHLLELLEQLRLRNLEAEQQLQEIRRLNGQLQLSNQEISQLLEERDRKNQQLLKINEDLDSFAHTVSHDLRAPLQNINALTVVLEACLEANDMEDANSVFPLLRDQTTKMDRLITGILAYSLAGHHNLSKQIIDLQVLLHQVIESLNVPSSFKLLVPQRLPLLYSQEIYLYQVFSNLIGNAVKYHDKPQDASIEIHYEELGDVLQFSVTDNGPGIAPVHQEAIFMKYETLGQSSNRSDSTGLGLSIVHKIIKEKEGRIWVESEGRGSKFIFTWPADEIVKEE